MDILVRHTQSSKGLAELVCSTCNDVLQRQVEAMRRVTEWAGDSSSDDIPKENVDPVRVQVHDHFASSIQMFPNGYQTREIIRVSPIWGNKN